MRGFPPIKEGASTQAIVRFLTFEEAAQFLAAASKEPQWYTMVLLALRTGMRIGELRALRWSDVNLKAGSVHVCRAFWRSIEGDPKGKPRS